jgi:dienelactone hydrolase
MFRAVVPVFCTTLVVCSTPSTQPAQGQATVETGAAEDRESQPVERAQASTDGSPDAGQDAAEPARTAAAPIDAGPQKLALPEGVVELPLEGFNPAAYVAPDQSTPPPWPLIVILHGNFDRPEWQCQTWAKEGRSRGWILCPRGYPREDAPAEYDRWTYKGRGNLSKELSAGVAALKTAHPELVRDDDAILIGFSLGAHMAPRFVSTKVLGFRYLVLAEGGYQVTQDVARSTRRHGIEKVVYLCGEKTACAMRAKGLNRFFKRAGIEAQTIVMPGVGHGYPDDVEPITRQTFEALGI